MDKGKIGTKRQSIHQSFPFLVSMMWACGFPVFLSWTAMSAHIPTDTKFSCTYSRTSCICFSLSSSTGSATSISLASCEFFDFSIFSTAFQRVERSVKRRMGRKVKKGIHLRQKRSADKAEKRQFQNEKS